jgi:hypothetical protein
LWSDPEQRGEIGRIAARLANPLNAKAVELGDQSVSIFKETMAAQKDAGNERDKMSAAMDGNMKLKNCYKKLQQLLEQAESQGRPISRIEKVISEVENMKLEIAGLIIN